MDRLEKRLKRAGFWNPVGRYAFGAATVIAAFALRALLAPIVGTGAPFVLFFAAILVTGLAAGIGPALACVLVGLPLAATYYVQVLGQPWLEALLQTMLYMVDGALVIYLALLMQRGRRRYEAAILLWQRADEKCEKAFERIRETVELAPDAYFLMDLDARIADVNQAAVHLVGYTHEELVGMSADELVAPGDVARLAALKSALLTPGAISKSEWTLRRVDGTLVDAEVSSNILPGGRWQMYVRDVSAAHRIHVEREELLVRERSARQAAETAVNQLRESEERFRLTVDEAPIGMALVDLDRRFARVNRALCEVTGYSSDELLAMTIGQITHPDDVERDAQLGDRLIRGETLHYQIPKRFIQKDQTIVDCIASAALLRAADGTPRYFIVQVEDVTERTRAEVALRRSEAKFSAIISIAADAIISTDAQQRITLFNSGAERIFGYRSAEIVGEPLSTLIPERFRKVHDKHFRNFAGGDQVARAMAERLEVFGLRKNGETFPAEASISKVSVDGEMIFSIVMHDVTYRKRVEQALQLAVAARDEVLGIVAHDLRNPLATIVMQLSSMERSGGEPERRDTRPLQVIARSADRMTHLLKDLLDVTVVEAGQLKLFQERLPARALVCEAVESQAPLASSAGIEVKYDVAADVKQVWGDHQRLLQVFENLIGNAVKFTKPGGRVTVAAVPADNGVEFRVTDTGPGIPPENLERLFERFWQATKRASRLGAGLGLPITRGIVEAHGGRIWVESTVGCGTTFHFSIPAEPVSSAPASSVPDMTAADAFAASPRR